MEARADYPAQGAAYLIGYGRTPPATRFKKGQSGNPKGRPKGAQNYRTVLVEELNAKVAVRENGRIKKMPKFQIGIKKFVNRLAEHGHVKDFIVVDKVLGAMESANGGTIATSDPSPLLPESKIGMLEWYFQKRLSQLDEEATPPDKPSCTASTEAGMGGQNDE